MVSIEEMTVLIHLIFSSNWFRAAFDVRSVSLFYTVHEMRLLQDNKSRPVHEIDGGLPNEDTKRDCLGGAGHNLPFYDSTGSPGSIRWGAFPIPTIAGYCFHQIA